VLGATHPHVRERHGETYRVMLEDRAQRLGVASSMIFHDRFVSQDELTEFLSAADIYITPYLKPSRAPRNARLRRWIGQACDLYTLFIRPRDPLRRARNPRTLAKDDPQAIARAVMSLLGDDAKRAAMRERGLACGRSMLWPAVARSYVQTFERARAEHAERLRTVFHVKTLAERRPSYPRSTSSI